MKKPEVIEKAKAAIIKNGLTPQSHPIRGGTDGATFSKMGLPTPNLGTGSFNHHGRYEYLVIQDFLKMIDIVVDILKSN
jgi:tripeptide aminopeptidase